ncbi:MAG: hypothetical protein K9N55_07320, partial [Phycisphaerae bacterium]|nr:hypothetical protein [Phycisphaerae bacterium]
MQWYKWCMGMVVLSFLAVSAHADFIVIENSSFESPHVDPNAFQALPFVDQWIEKDNDGELSTNTGVFPNPAAGGFGGHLANAEGEQVAFLGSEQGNSLEQDLTAVYESGYAYRLTVAVGMSSMFPPSELNSLELAFYYYDGNEPVNIGTKYLSASDLLLFELVDVSLTLPIVGTDHAWAGQPMGIAIRSIGPASGFWDLDNVRVEALLPVTLDVGNASFETPVVDPLMFPALPYVTEWTELDHDLEASSNTGVFPNPALDSPGHLLHAEGQQLAFLGSEEGNGFEQVLESVYQTGFSYQLTVGVGVSGLFPPSAENSLAVVLYYMDQNEPVDIAAQSVPAPDYTSDALRDVTVTLDPVGPNDLWTGQPVGVAIRAMGPASGFWDLDNVRVSELVSSLPAVENPSFESPAIDPNAYPVLPLVGQWTEIDQDGETSTNTGVFLNT